MCASYTASPESVSMRRMVPPGTAFSAAARSFASIAPDTAFSSGFERCPGENRPPSPDEPSPDGPSVAEVPEEAAVRDGSVVAAFRRGHHQRAGGGAADEQPGREQGDGAWLLVHGSPSVPAQGGAG